MDFHIPVKTFLVWFESSETEIIVQQTRSSPSFPWLLPGGRNLKHEVWLYNMNICSMAKVTNSTKNRQGFISGQGTGSSPAHGPWAQTLPHIQTGIVWVFPLFICFWPMQGPVRISALEGDNIIPQFATWDANMRNKLGDDQILTICKWNSWGPVVFTKIKNACQALTTFHPSISTHSLHFLFFTEEQSIGENLIKMFRMKDI